MSVAYSLKITTEEEEKRKEEDRRTREVEEFVHRYRDFANPATAYAVDSLTILEFRRQAKEFIYDTSIDDYYKMMIRRMEMNVRAVENRRYELYRDAYRPLWYF